MSDRSSQRPGTEGSVDIVETDYIPPCPHCRKPLQVILKNLIQGMTQSEAVYSCNECGELLGIGYDRA
jgi:hypothetical protein